MDNMPIGKHCILEVSGCPFDILNDAKYINNVLEHAAQAAHSTLLNLRTHTFQPFGVTGLALLAESHISIHTWPENGYAAIDVFTCGEHTLPEDACKFMIEKLGARDYTLSTLDRGAPSIQKNAQPQLHERKEQVACLA